MRHRSIIILLALALGSPVCATHIIGGELYYEHLSGNDYEITLKIYRDCGPNNTNGTGYDPTVEIGVFDAAGNYLFSESIAFPGATQVPVVLNNPCLSVPPTICVEEAVYTGLITLPSGTGGYVLAYQRCCRTPVTLNLDNPQGQGLTCTVTVPDASISGVNSSPHFALYPPIALCANEPMVFDHSAVDPDGDQLTYELCTPYQGADSLVPLPSPPAGPPYLPVVWAPGYSQANMMNSVPPLAIDAVTGELSATPTLVGSFVVGVKVKEFRNGVLLSEVIRDLRFDVVPCIVNVVSAIQQQQTLCTGLTIDFINQSLNSTSFFWDFGEANLTTDTSSLMAPSYTYQDSGTFTVTLIANPGWSCADTSTMVYEIHDTLDPFFPVPAITCFDRQPVTLVTTGSFTSNAQVVWISDPLV